MRGFMILLLGSLSMLIGSDLHSQELQSTKASAKILKFEIDVEDLGVDPVVQEKDRVLLGPDALRLDSDVDDSGTPLSSLVFRRRDRSYLILFHESKEAVVYDLAEFKEFTEKSEALQNRLWERLAEGRPPEEAEILTKMRESKRETARLGQEAMQAGLELKKTEETGELDGHPWRKYQEFRHGTLSREFLVTPWTHLGVQDETSRIFEEIKAFDDQKREFSQGMNRAPDPFGHYVEFGGFPVVVRQFDGGGNIVYTATVTSIEEVEDSGDLFQNPGYQEEGMADRVRVIGEGDPE